MQCFEAFLKDYKISCEQDTNGEKKCIVARIVVDNTEENRVALATLSNATVRVEPQQLHLPEAANA